MSDLVKRLRASVKMDAHNGDAVERSICGKQMLEAANRIEGLEQDLADYKEGTEGMRLSIGDLRRERDELGQIVADLRRQLA
ncbi:MAG TPA: hypothetical protein VMV40_00820, partial [Acidiferrobacter sp.]|nr:hypothetical protein [Acidiferrobacter sp.]